ncbi:MAG: hypothetical protein IPJ76_11865 [Flavobacteriales bacterium]|nr:MAG: hypothetical protein IPJ76_11865 [Flavobacteriales bacterium]
MRAGIVILSLFLLNPHPMQGQALRFQHLTTDDGLSDNAITCVFEDRAGYIWIGTENGLNKYDGSTVLQVAGTEASIAAVIEDRQGTVWAATKDKGLIRVGSGNAVRRFDRDDALGSSMASDKLTALYDLDDTTLLIGSREVTLMFLDKRTFRFTYWTDSATIAPARASPAPSNTRGWCHAITLLNDQHLWIGLLNYYLSFIVDRRTGSITHYPHVQRPGSQTLTCAMLIGDSIICGGWQNGADVIAWNDLPASLKAPPVQGRIIPTQEEVIAITDWNNGPLFAIRQSGLLHLPRGSRSPVRIVRDRTDPASLSSDRVRCLLRDRKGTLWAGTSNGLDFHVPDVWRFGVQDIHNDPDGDEQEVYFHRAYPEGVNGVRILTSDGFFIQRREGDALEHQSYDGGGRALQPTVMGKDHQGRSIVGTEYGIGFLAEQGGKVRAALEPHVVNEVYSPGTMYQVRGLQADTLNGRPVMVIATMGFGVHVVDVATQKVLGRAMPGLTEKVNSYSLVSSMARDAEGRYWYGTANGLCNWHASEGIHDWSDGGAGPGGPQNVVVTGEDVRSVMALGNTIWAVSRAGALVRARVDNVERFAPPAHMPQDLYAMTMDRAGRFWVTTGDGLLRFDTTDHSFLHVPVNDGQRFRKLGNAITTLNDGRIALCADNSLITFPPSVFDDLPVLPTAFFAGATAAGKALRVEDAHVELSYRSSVVDIGVSAMALGHPQALLLEYRLDGVEEEWRTIPIDERIRYAGVPVGAHRLLVKVRDAFGRTGPEQVLLTVAVPAPFWLTWWFYALIVLLSGAGMYAWSRNRIAQALKLQAVRNRIASDLHDEVGSSLSSITIGSQLASSLSPVENEQLHKLLARIGETSSESLRSISDIVWAIDPKNDEGEALVKRMRRIANELLESKGIDVSFNVSGGVEDLKLPMNARKELVLLYKEAVHNASKYSGANTVQVSLHQRNGTLNLSVKDDGRGFDPALHPDGHGLGSMARRAASLGGRFTLTSAPGMGVLIGVEVDVTRIRD